jgi:hypothetical protein
MSGALWCVWVEGRGLAEVVGRALGLGSPAEEDGESVVEVF